MMVNLHFLITHSKNVCIFLIFSSFSKKTIVLGIVIKFPVYMKSLYFFKTVKNIKKHCDRIDIFISDGSFKVTKPTI